MEAIECYVRGAFQGVPETPEALEQQEELVANMTAKVADLMSDGRGEEEAVGLAIASMGDLASLVSEFVAETVLAEPMVDAYAARLKLHSAVLASGGVLATVVILSLIALGAHIAVWEQALVGMTVLVALVGWVTVRLVQFHESGRVVMAVRRHDRARFMRALSVGVVMGALALLVNALVDPYRLWGWVLVIAGAAWPLGVKIEEWLLAGGKFVAGRGER